MFTRRISVHGCSVGNSPLGATSNQSPVNLHLIGAAHGLTTQSHLSSSREWTAKLRRFIKRGIKINASFFRRTKPKGPKEWLLATANIWNSKIPAQVLVRARVKIRFEWIFDRIRVCVTIANYVCTSCYWRQQIYWLSFCFRPLSIWILTKIKAVEFVIIIEET